MGRAAWAQRGGALQMLQPRILAPTSSSLYRWVAQLVRDLYPSVQRQAPHERAPAMRDAIVLPLVDPITAHLLAAQLGQCGGELRRAAETLDKLCVRCHNDNVGEFLRVVKGDVSEDMYAAIAQNPSMAKGSKDPYKIACGKRLVLARTALGFPKRRDWARITLESETQEDLERSEDRLKTWELGDVLVPPTYADKIKRAHSITTDYIYSGDVSGLPHGLAIKIIQLQEPDESDSHH